MTGLLTGLAAILAVLTGLYFVWARRVRAEIAEGAGVAWERLQRDEPALLHGVDRKRFASIYSRSCFPRFPKYFLASLAAFIVALPVALGLLAGASWGLERIGLVAEPVELAKYVPMGQASTDAERAQRAEMALHLAKNFSGFYYFFGVLGAWILILAGSMRFYHLRRPGDLREELLRARDVARSDAGTQVAASDPSVPEDAANEG